MIYFTVYWPYAAANATELSVKKKDTVALVEVTGYEAKPPEGYIRVSYIRREDNIVQ